SCGHHPTPERSQCHRGTGVPVLWGHTVSCGHPGNGGPAWGPRQHSRPYRPSEEGRRGAVPVPLSQRARGGPGSRHRDRGRSESAQSSPLPRSRRPPVTAHGLRNLITG
ncbi:hypothetical protein Celaphus_00018448, partial [Cervus elaphus hippelaphus]